MKRKVEVFTAGCPLCEKAVELVRRTACPSCEVIVHDLRNSGKAVQQAVGYGVNSVPSVVVDGRLVDCCVRQSMNPGSLTAYGVGRPL